MAYNAYLKDINNKKRLCAQGRFRTISPNACRHFVWFWNKNI